jgi:hypothetical protein
LADSALVIIMAGATTITCITIGVAAALVPLIPGILCALTAYGRWAEIRQV